MIDREKVVRAVETCFESWIDRHRNMGLDLQAVEQMKRDALEMLKEQKSEWLEDSDPGQEYGTTWACAECGCSIHERTVWNPYRAGFKYCPFCGDRMVKRK